MWREAVCPKAREADSPGPGAIPAGPGGGTAGGPAVGRAPVSGAVLVAAGGHVASAAEIKLLSAGAMRAVAVALLPDFEKQTGHKVTIDNGTAGGLSKRIGEGEAFDVAIITPAVVDDLAGKGKIVPCRP